MKTKFTSVQAHKNKWGWKLIAGLWIVGLVLTGNVLDLFMSGRLKEVDISYCPPHVVWIQHLLFKPIDIRQEPYVKKDDIYDFFEGFDSGPDEVIASAGPTVINRPSFTSVVGKEYRFRPRVDLKSLHEFELISGPSGFAYDPQTRSFSWIPDRRGKNRISLAAFDSETNQGTTLEYTLFTADRFHVFGTDLQGRDIGANLVRGSRWAILPGLISVLVSVILGLCIGGYAGFWGGRIDKILTLIMKLSSALPALVLLFLASVIFRYNIFAIMMVLGFVQFPKVALGIKNKVLVLKEHQFIEAGHELGLGSHTILWKEIIWANSRPQILQYASYGLAYAVLIEVSLSYLHLGIQPPEMSWGTLLFEGYKKIAEHVFWPVVMPSLTIFIVVLGFYMVADGIHSSMKLKEI